MYQPDSIDTYQYERKSYLVTANEGDARDYWSSNYTGESECLVDGGLEWNSDDGCLFFSEAV